MECKVEIHAESWFSILRPLNTNSTSVWELWSRVQPPYEGNLARVDRDSEEQPEPTPWKLEFRAKFSFQGAMERQGN